MTAAIARAEPIDYPAETRGLNFFDLDVNLRRLLWRRAPGLLERHEARLGDFGAWVGGPLDAQAATREKLGLLMGGGGASEAPIQTEGKP